SRLVGGFDRGRGHLAEVLGKALRRRSEPFARPVTELLPQRPEQRSVALGDLDRHPPGSLESSSGLGAAVQIVRNSRHAGTLADAPDSGNPESRNLQDDIRLIAIDSVETAAPGQ